MKITVVVPVLNERPTLERLVQDIGEHIAPHRYRLIFVDDGSTDGSWEEMQRLQKAYPHIEAIRFPRNFGKTAALDVAFREADGDLVLMMDADLQDDPREIPRLIEKLEEGYDMVCGWKQSRHDPWHKTLPSRLFNGLLGFIFDFDLRDINTGFKVMRLPVAKQLRLFSEMHRMVAVQAHEQGYRVAEIPVVHHPRRFGKSKFGLERIFRGFRDAFIVWILYRCKGGPARYFGRNSAMAFGGALLLLLIIASLDSTLPMAYSQSLTGKLLFGAATGCATLAIAYGVFLLCLGVYGAKLILRIPDEDPDYPVADRIGGE